MPELKRWNSGKGIPASEWIIAEGRADHALGFCALVWPEISMFEGYILREPINEKSLRINEDGWDRKQIETAMNCQFLEDIFPQDTGEPQLKGEQIACLARVMVEMLTAKLITEFPDRQFSVFVIDDGEDFAVTFHQN